MKLFEYEAKNIFRGAGIPVPESRLTTNMQDALQAAFDIGFPCVLKSQVLRGGRGKAGLIQFAASAEEAEQKAKELFEGNFNVKKILIEKAVDISREIYLSVTVDAANACALIMACPEGGVDIETMAAESPEKIIMERVDMSMGLLDFQVREVVSALGVNGDALKELSRIIKALYGAFCRYDAELAEINPLFITSAGEVIAGDGKLIIDDNSMFRQPDFQKTRDYFDNDIEYEAFTEGIPYLQFDGNISLMCAGAGLTNTVYDLINYAGGAVANYLEFGGPNYTKARRAMEICLKNKSSVILIVTFGTIARADVMAKGVVDAVRELKPDRPVITCIRGTNEEEAFEILRSAGMECITDTEEAVAKAVEIAAERKRSGK